MHWRNTLIVLSSVLFFFTAEQAVSGDYYRDDGGYRTGYSDTSYRSSSCCYRRVVRYERVYGDRAYHGDYGYRRPHYSSHRSYDYGRPHYSSYRSYSYGRPYYSSYRSYGYAGVGPSDYGYRVSSSSYYARPRSYYPEGCYSRRVRVDDDRGGWVWRSRTVCN